MQHILSLSGKFYKSAGIFDAPPRMVEKLTEMAISIYASAILYAALKRGHIFSETKNNKLFDIARNNKLIEEARKYARAPHRPANVSILLDVDLDGWRYLNGQAKTKFVEQFITCNFVFVKSIPKNLALFFPRTNTIEIYFYRSNSRDEFRAFIENLKITVNHELQHFGQVLLSKLRGINYQKEHGKPGNLAGLPGAKIRPQNQDYEGHYLLKNRTTTNKSELALHDVEFYTMLSDSIQEFKPIALRLPKEIRKEFAKAWVGEPNNFRGLYYTQPPSTQAYIYTVIGGPFAREPFKTLVAKDIKKWEKAVKEFYSKISYLL